MEAAAVIGDPAGTAASGFHEKGPLPGLQSRFRVCTRPRSRRLAENGNPDRLHECR
jgi:hypothetical protein